MANSRAEGVKSSFASLGDRDSVEKVFSKFDANGDGKISASELRTVLRLLGSDAPPTEVDRMMAHIDADGDGFINLKEFSDFLGCGPAAGDDDAKELKDAFDIYDSDGNGLISASELHEVLKSLGEKCTLPDCSRMIRSVDVDGDGFVNFEEFKKMMKPHV